MMNVGDFVSHIGFPPASGVIAGIRKSSSSQSKDLVGVRLDDGRLMWDDEDTWECLSEDGEVIDSQEIV